MNSRDRERLSEAIRNLACIVGVSESEVRAALDGIRNFYRCIEIDRKAPPVSGDYAVVGSTKHTLTWETCPHCGRGGFELTAKETHD